MRLFVGTFPPPAIADRCATIAEALRAVPGARIVSAPRIHVTLAFLGDQPLDLVAPLEDALRAHLATLAPEPVRASEVTGFPTVRRARVAVVALEPGALRAVHAATAAALRQVGLVPEVRPFRPHLTIARFRSPATLPDVPIEALAWTADAAILVRSRLGAGARYEALATIPLQG